MLINLDWLRDFVPYEGEVQALADQLTMLGLEVEEIYNPFEHLDKLVVGHVVEREKHPEADKLSLCKVDVGDEILQIVCGAPNVAQGQKVAVAKIGAVLPGDFKIKKSKIRGVESFGMICSERELELSEDHEGIMVLEENLAPGTRLVDALDLPDTIIGIDLTPNRGDCLSMLGVAREVAMSFDLPLTLPRLNLKEEGPELSELAIDIPEPEYCPMYSARRINGVSVGKSPAWMRYRLQSVGIRPISNVVDVTNYILMELGQPLHAFDADLLAGNRIRVARAEDGMKFTTLDGVERTLLSSDLLIWDAEKPVALAGVMGGLNSEMHADSKNVVLECAVFHPATIRKTARRLALHSDASHRFERGIDQVGAAYALDRAAQLISELAGGSVCKGVAKAEPAPWKQPTLRFRPEKARTVIGIPVDNDFCARTLTGLGCKIEEEDSADWMVHPPSHRLDLEREIDLVEEVCRVYGIDRIPATLPEVLKEIDGPKAEGSFEFVSRIKHWARGVGLAEAINYSFVGTRDLDQMNLAPEGRVMIANPLSEEQNVMRTDICAGLLQNLRHNIGQGNANLRLFEVAKTFFVDEESDTNTRETEYLAILLHGSRHASGYPWSEEASDYSDIKGLLLDLARTLALPEPTFALKEGHPWMAPCVGVSVNGAEIGAVGMVNDELAAALKARSEVWMANINLAALRKRARKARIEFKDLPKFPPSRRDVTFVAPRGMHVGDILDALRGQKQPLLEDVALIDEYRPEGAETANLTFRLTYRSPSKTLKDKEVDKTHKRITDAVTKALPVSYQQ